MSLNRAFEGRLWSYMHQCVQAGTPGPAPPEVLQDVQQREHVAVCGALSPPPQAQCLHVHLTPLVAGALQARAGCGQLARVRAWHHASMALLRTPPPPLPVSPCPPSPPTWEMAVISATKSSPFRSLWPHRTRLTACARVWPPTMPSTPSRLMPARAGVRTCLHVSRSSRGPWAQ